MSKGRKPRGRTPKRRRAVRPKKKRILIVGEGRETEPNYFAGLKREDNVHARWVVKVRKGPGQSPEEVVKRAVELQKQADKQYEYDEVWCVLDVEGPANRKSLDRAIALAEKEGVTVCLSNPAFEVWLLAHYKRTTKSFADAKAVVKALNKYWQEHHNQTYRKNGEDVYRRVSEHTETAIKNARWVFENHQAASPNAADRNSSTEVFRLVEKLIRTPARPTT